MKNFSRRPLLVKSLAGALLLHGAFVALLIKYPLLFTDQASLFLRNKPLVKATEEEDPSFALEKALEEFFASFSFGENVDKDPSDLPLLAQPLEEHPHPPQQPFYKGQDLALQNGSCIPLPSRFFARSEESLPYLETIPLDIPAKAFFLPEQKPLLADSLEQEAPLAIDTLLEGDLPTALPFKEPSSTRVPTLASLPPLPLQEKEFRGSTESAPLPSREARSPSLQAYCPPYEQPNVPLSSSRFADIETHLPLQALFSLQWNNSFQIASSFFPDEEGYIFSLTLTLKENLEAKRIPQNIHFVIDTSSNVEAHKTTLFKHAVLKALSTLQPQDRFNIYLLESETTKLSQDVIPFSFATLRLAEEFLERKSSRSFFSSFDLLKSLETLFSSFEDNGEMHTVILLTNGQLSSSLEERKDSLSQLLEKHGKKITLFAAGAGKNNDIVTLDMLSSLLRGRFLYSDTNTALPRKLTQFMKTLQSPLLQDVSLSLEPLDPKAGLCLLPLSSSPPNLYQKEPLVIMGRINRLCPLKISLEGRNGEEWILLNKEVSFEEAGPSTSLLKKEWGLRQTAKAYIDFLENPKQSHLTRAKELLKAAQGRTLGE